MNTPGKFSDSLRLTFSVEMAIIIMNINLCSREEIWQGQLP